MLGTLQPSEEPPHDRMEDHAIEIEDDFFAWQERRITAAPTVGGLAIVPELLVPPQKKSELPQHAIVFLGSRSVGREASLN